MGKFAEIGNEYINLMNQLKKEKSRVEKKKINDELHLLLNEMKKESNPVVDDDDKKVLEKMNDLFPEEEGNYFL